MQIVAVSSEVAPFSRTGGLGYATAEIAAALARRGHTVATVSPRYGTLDPAAVGAEDTGIVLDLELAGTTHPVRVLRVVDDDGVHHLLLEHPVYGDRDGIYADEHGAFGDEHFRFALLCRAAIAAVDRVRIAGASFGDELVLHAHDWQAALVPVYLREDGRGLPTVLTVHNLQHQGRFPGDRFADLGLSGGWFAPGGVEYHGDVNLLKAGLLHAHQVTTVSPSFAEEIRTPEGGFGLDGVLRGRAADLTGILNGIDTQVWDPSADPHLPAHYDASDLEGKTRCKGALQAEMGLAVDARVPLVASVGRLDPQKGVDLLLESIPWLAGEQGCQVVVLGSAGPAHRHYEDALRDLEARYPRHVRAWIGYSEPLAHLIEAGADLFCMPSAFEPCGLNQMYSQRYGTPPVVRAVGGLVDSVDPATRDGSAGTGWLFQRYEGQALRDALWVALDCLRDRPEAFAAIQRRGMGRDFSWDASVIEYEAVFEAALAQRP